jgi:hypothetical protein
MRRTGLILPTLLFMATCPGLALSASTESSYLALSADTLVSSTMSILSTTITLPGRRWTYVQSDGRYFPLAGRAANTVLFIDGARASNDAFIDWRASTNPQQHGFNVIAAKRLPKGHIRSSSSPNRSTGRTSWDRAPT